MAKYRQQRKSMKMDMGELTDTIKACVKEVMEEGTEDKDDVTDETSVDEDVADLIEHAVALAEEKRKSRKEAGEEVDEGITPEEIIEAVGEILSDEEKEGEPQDEEKEDETDPENPEDKRKGAATLNRERKARKSAPVQRKYQNIYMNIAGGNFNKEEKKIPPMVQLARAVKCIDVFGKHDLDAAAYHAEKKYGDKIMAREFKALSATNPTAGGYTIPEMYIDQIIEMLYSKTVIFELGAQKVPMDNGNLNIPKLTSGARARWGGEGRKINKTQPTYGNIKLSAKRLEAIIPQTRELLMSTSFSADEMFARDLTRRMELGLDFGAMFGSGGEFEPMGIAKHKDVQNIDAKTINNTELSTSSGVITADFPIYIRSIVLNKNVDDIGLGWTFNAMLEGLLMNMKTTTGAYIYREEMASGKLLGFPYKVSNQISTDSNGLSSLIFGNWNDLLVGEQLGLETYTTLEGSWVDEDGIQHNAFEENLAATRALMYVDIAPRHAESFIYCKNIKVM